MTQNFITMNGYGLFVWLSFSITILTCAIVYYKTRKTLKCWLPCWSDCLNLSPGSAFLLRSVFRNLCGGTPWTDFDLFWDPPGPIF